MRTGMRAMLVVLVVAVVAWMGSVANAGTAAWFDPFGGEDVS